MAVTIQSLVTTPYLRAFKSPFPDQAIANKTSMPFGEILHVGSDTLDGGGVGNEAALRLFFPLPVNFGYALQNLIVTKRGSDASWGYDQPPMLEMYLANNENIPQNETTQLDIPLNNSLSTQAGIPTQALGQVVTFSLGGGRFDTSADMASPWGQPYPTQFGYWDSLTQTGTVPVFTMGVDVQDTAAGTISWYSRWLVYNLDQYSNAGLNWRLPVTS